MSEFFPKPKSLRANIKVELDLSNYATKSDSKNATGFDTSDFAKKTDLANLKSDVNKLDIGKLRNVPTNLSNLKRKVHKLDVVKKDVYNAKIKNIEGKIPDFTNLATNTILNAKINEIKDGIPSITNLAGTAALTTVENKIPNVSNLVKNKDYDAKISAMENKYFTTFGYDKFTSNTLDAKITQKKVSYEDDLNEKIKTWQQRKN